MKSIEIGQFRLVSKIFEIRTHFQKLVSFPISLCLSLSAFLRLCRSACVTWCDQWSNVNNEPLMRTCDAVCLCSLFSAHSGLLDDHKLCANAWVDMLFKSLTEYTSFFFLFSHQTQIPEMWKENSTILLHLL